jgi:hypothetical protein
MRWSELAESVAAMALLIVLGPAAALGQKGGQQGRSWMESGRGPAPPSTRARASPAALVGAPAHAHLAVRGGRW